MEQDPGPEPKSPSQAPQLPHLDAAWDPSLQDEDTDEFCWTELQLASRNGDLALVQALLAQDTSLANAPATGYYGQTALQAACMQGHEEVVAALLAAGADVDAPGGNNMQRNALQFACTTGHARIIEMLLTAGARVNAGTGGRPVTRYNGRTALQAAAEGGHEAVVRRLLELGAT